TGIQCYALFSEAAVQASHLLELTFPLVEHSESYEHIGEVTMQVLDLHLVWEQQQEKARFVVQPEEGWLTFEWDAPKPISLVWEYMTNLRLELEWAGFDLAERTDENGGRFREGSEYHCAHGDSHFFTRILDWKPFHYVSLDQSIGGTDVRLIQSRILTETPDGVKINFYIRKPEAPVPEELKENIVNVYNEVLAAMVKMLQKDLKEKTVEA
ncbi:MAG TPA: hypothetical protein DCX53_14585, partial [Anaerolineae bacterium]|nr:hypothetical protein [Anaerolineae bacterium]